MDYEDYKQKGGSAILPVEIFDDLLNEYEDLQKENEKFRQAFEDSFIESEIMTNNILQRKNEKLNKGIDELIEKYKKLYSVDNDNSNIYERLLKDLKQLKGEK